MEVVRSHPGLMKQLGEKATCPTFVHFFPHLPQNIASSNYQLIRFGVGQLIETETDSAAGYIPLDILQRVQRQPDLLEALSLA